jgi:regulator of protease activity HflC (stomatin/prohibitin superfamily)
MGKYIQEVEDHTAVKGLKYLLVLVVGLWILFSIVVIVPAGNRGVLMTWGAVQDPVLNEGIHFIMPVAQSVQIMEVRTQKYEVPASAATMDLLDVQTTIAVNFHLDPKVTNKIYQEIGMDYEGRLIAPAVQEVTKANTATFNAQELITSRPIVKQKIDDALRIRLQERGIIVETISITDFKFPAQFNDAITSKQTAIQLKQKAENDLERIKVEAQQAVAQATGQSQSIEIINEQLKKSPQYIQYLATTKWDGKLPYATSGTPLIQLPTYTGG